MIRSKAIPMTGKSALGWKKVECKKSGGKPACGGQAAALQGVAPLTR